MSSTDRQNNLLVSEDWQKIYQSFKNADFQSYDFDNLRRTMIDYIRTNFPEDFNDYIESSEYLALIDLIAYVGQSIAFRVDLNARENFLELASRRDSVLRLARMISYNSSRNLAASGLMKFSTISTDENVIDNNGRNLSGQIITWNDGANSNWYDQFIKIINAALPSTSQYGTPVDTASIYGVSTAQYKFNATNADVPVYSFTKTVNGSTMSFEVTSTTFNGKSFIYEEAPKVGNSISCIYQDDGYGAGSATTGFFFNFKQGTLNTATFTITQPSNNQQIDIPVQNINNTDIWLYSLDQSGRETKLWTQVPAVNGSNIIYNNLNGTVKTIYQVITRANDQVSLSFGDGTFGQLPLGTFRVYYRSSNSLSYSINPADLRNISIAIPYTSASGQSHTLTVYLNLTTTVSNSSPSETNASIQQKAPQTYYTQNRMITGEDYNISPLSANLQVAKVKSLNRTSSGISRYFDLVDPTGKYSSTNLFADDGILFIDNYTSSIDFTYLTQLDIENVILSKIYNILNTPDLRNFYYKNFVNYINLAGAADSIIWTQITSDSTESSGYVGSLQTGLIAAVGSFAKTDTRSNLIYVTEGALIKVIAPTGKYFNTKQNNRLVAIDPTKGIPLNGVTYLWVEIVNIADDGRGQLDIQTKKHTGVLSTGYGAIALNRTIPTGAIIQQVIPNFIKTIDSTTKSTMIDLIFDKQQFGLRYDSTSQSWKIIFQTNLNISSEFSLNSQGDISNSQKDSSWVLLFTTNNLAYTVTTRYTRYIFESDKQLTFYFDTSTKIYDIVSSKTIIDNIKILSINPTSITSTQSFTTDLVWDIVSEFNGADGYVDPAKIVLSFADSDNNGIVDNPQLFDDIVTPLTDPLTKYIVQKKYLISKGQEDYKYVPNDPVTSGPVLIKSTKPGSGISGMYYYFVDTNIVTQNINGVFVPTLDYKVYVGRDNLKFQYIHSADYDSRIDPGASNIIDIYVLTVDYDIKFRQWLSGANINKPLPPSSSQLNSLLSSNLDLIKAISDEIIYHPVNYKLLFGAEADTNLQATFNVISNPNVAISNSEIVAGVLIAINQFFALENWNFGDTFYFTELSTYVVTQMSPNITNFVIVPKQSGQYFGSLFEIQCPANQLFISCAKASDIAIVSGFTSSNLKTVTGDALTNAIISQNITSAPNGVSN
jgi:hypothetical protein